MQQWKGLKENDICFSVIYSCYDQNLIPGRETGHQAPPETNFDIFLISPSFLRSWVVQQPVKQLVYKVNYTRNQVWLNLWGVKPDSRDYALNLLKIAEMVTGEQ